MAATAAAFMMRSWVGRPVVIRLQVRRFVCAESGCARVTFTEQIPGLTTLHARYTPPLRAALTSIVVAWPAL